MKMQVLTPLIVTALISITWQTVAAVTACQRRCGGVDIPYPFGIGRGCYLDTGDRTFEVTCGEDTATDGAAVRPLVDHFEVLGIDLERGKLRIRSPVSSWCYDGASRDSMGEPETWSYSSTTALRVSDEDNKLVVVGCNAFAYGDVDGRYVVGCHAECASAASLVNGSCDGGAGAGCCQMPIPRGIKSIGVFFDDTYNNSGVAGFSPCSYAVVAEAAAFEFRTTYVTTGELRGDAGKQVPTALDWAVGNRTCREARRQKAAYACVSENSECVDSRNGPGYLCNCTAGYQGNPYVIGGCQDINECEEKGSKHPCASPRICTNTMGAYECSCPAHTRPSSNGTCEANKSETRWQVAIGVSIGVVVLAVGMSCTYTIQEKRRLAVIKARHFRQHGGLLLFEQMKSKQQQGQSFTLFTREELQESTGNFDERHVLGKGGNGTVYKGTLKDGREVAIKKCRHVDDERQQREFGKEMLILSQVNHKNIVKLYGCCLEVEVPMLVYEFIPNGTLFQLIHGGGEVPFPVRLKIAREVAGALAYLHSMASPPIIHGDVKSPNILLDEGYAATVSDFGAAAALAADEAHLVTFVQGTCGYLDPEYMQTCRLTDKSDVYSFGVVLLELLTRRKALNLAAPDEERSLAAHFLSAVRGGRLDELLDDQVKREVRSDAIERVAKLAKMCLEMSGEKRPSMREVTEELDRIRKILSQNDLCFGKSETHSFVLVSER